VTIAARQPERATRLGVRLGLAVTVLAYDSAQPSAALRAAVARARLVINSTPIGLHGDAMPLSPDTLAPGTRVLDLVYRPEETPWVRACRAHGCLAEDGLRMLVEQGAEAFAWWFGVAPDREVMWRALGRERTGAEPVT
jgi:shikimate dehydrogenase